MANCEITASVIKDIESVVHNQRAAVQLFLLAAKKPGNLNDNLKKLVSDVVYARNYQPKSINDMEKLLSWMAKSGISQHNGRLGYESYYTAKNNEELAAYIVGNKNKYSYARVGSVSWDEVGKDYFYFG
jgi:hypothetical protein